MTMIFRHGFFHGDPHPANVLVLAARADRPRRLRPPGKLSDDDMSKLTRLFIEPRTRTSRRCRSGSPTRCALRQVPRGRVRRPHPRAVRPLLRRAAVGDRPDAADPRGLPAHLRHEPAAADAVPDARQGDRDARRGRGRALPGLQRLRGGEAVRARSRRSSASRRSGCSREARKEATSLGAVLREAPYQWHDFLEQVATARSRSASSTRAWTSSCRASSRGSTGS